MIRYGASKGWIHYYGPGQQVRQKSLRGNSGYPPVSFTR